MAEYPQTGSILDSKTRTALSTQIVVMVNGEAVGAIQSFSETQNRSARRVFEIGVDGTLEIVPESPATFSLRIDRIVYDGLNVTEAMSRGFRNIQAQRIPFDIVVIDNYTGVDLDAVITTYENCWFTSIEKSYNADNYIITENVGVEVENIKTLRGGEAVALSQGTGGARQIPLQIDEVELLADSGVRRGSLDFPGLISASF
jgi:hypothetical protein